MSGHLKVGVTTFGGDGGKSGISQYIINLLNEFSKMENAAQFEVMVYENEKDIFVPRENGLKSLCFSEKIQNPIRNVAWHQSRLPHICKRQKYDVMFLPAGNRRLPMSSPCPTVGTVHDFSSIHVKAKYDPARMFYITRVLPFLIRRLTRILTVSESSKRDIVEYARVPEEFVTVTPLAADPKIYFPRDQEESFHRVANKFSVTQPYMLFISRIEHPGKNHAKLIEAFNLLKAREHLPHQLVLAGSDWNGAAEVHRLAEASPFKNDIMFTGFVRTEDLPDLFCGSELFVFPSLYEGFGLPVLEAMSCKVPVACSNLSSMPEVAGDAGLLFDPYEVEHLTETLKMILTNDALRQDLAERGYQRSRCFTWEATAQKTMQVIQNACAR
ncbi:MAG: glycosyltransferase family 1 protein [Acidobacteriota bacterium]